MISNAGVFLTLKRVMFFKQPFELETCDRYDTSYIRKIHIIPFF